MRTNIDIDDDLMARAMQAGPFKTKREAVEAGLKLLTRQAAYREILKWRGKLKWEGEESIDWTQAPANATSDQAAARGESSAVHEPKPSPYGSSGGVLTASTEAVAAATSTEGRKRRARR